jgi:CheY-like chemotaxis protein
MTSRRLTVVYVDDDDIVRETITAMLTDEDADVHACELGSEAIALCKQMSPDAALLDLNMPEIDGLEVARRLRADPETKDLRLVALTGRATWDLALKASQAGFDEFLTKPVTVAALLRALRNVTPGADPDRSR